MDRPGVPETMRVYWTLKALLAEISWKDIEANLLEILDKIIDEKTNGAPLIFPDTLEEYHRIKQLLGGLRNAQGESTENGQGAQDEEEVKAQDEVEEEVYPEVETGAGTEDEAQAPPRASVRTRAASDPALSILIPARNEMFLTRTIQDILENSEADTEIIATLDGEWADPPVPQHDRVNIIYVPEPVGQRAATNLAAKIARGKYVMKLDAHCSFDKGFDRMMLEAASQVPDDVTLVPIMRNLWAFDWKCFHCGWKQYQSSKPEKCGDPKCGKSDRIKMKMVWKGKSNPQSWTYSFDSQPHFQYFNDYKGRPGVREQAQATGFTETMSLQGSCFMATRDKYWELKLCDESFGSWGNQGIEVALKTWLSGGRVLVYHKTWYSHMFRTNAGFSFPYEQRGRQIAKTKENVWNFFLNGNWNKQIHPVSWLVEKFWPVPGWTEDNLNKLKESEVKHNGSSNVL